MPLFKTIFSKMKGVIIIFIICLFSILHAITRDEVTREEFMLECRIQNLRTRMNNDIRSQHDSSQFMMKNNDTPYNTNLLVDHCHSSGLKQPST